MTSFDSPPSPVTQKPIIDARSVSKRYRLGTIGLTSLRDELARSWENVRALWQPEVPANGSEPGPSTEFWALRNVSFTVQAGDVVGIIGRNGAGKSTLLKILSRITQQTSGEITLRGRVASLLEVGTGFHPELSGRDNIYLNGAILGMTKDEIRRRFDDIVGFAEVERFLDTPVKRYSSGMYVRLAFAVAAHLQMDILVVDEVLAVGDAAFQAKCLEKMNEVSAGGRTVLFVSHNLSAMQGLCTRGIWLDAGEIAAEGPIRTVVEQYLSDVNLSRGREQSRRVRTDAITVVHSTVRDSRGAAAFTIRPWESFSVDVEYDCDQRIEAPRFWVTIASQFGPLFSGNMLLDGLSPQFIEGRGVLRCSFDSPGLLAQSYTVNVGACDASGTQVLFELQGATMFSVVGDSRDYGFEGDRGDAVMVHSTPVLVPYSWRMPDGSAVTPAWCRRKELM